VVKVAKGKMKPKNPQITVTEPEIKQELAVFASLLPVVTGIAVRKNNVSRQPSNSGRREGTFKGPAEFKRLIDEKYGTQFTSHRSMGRLLKYIPSRSGSGSRRSWPSSPISIRQRKSF